MSIEQSIEIAQRIDELPHHRQHQLLLLLIGRLIEIEARSISIGDVLDAFEDGVHLGWQTPGCPASRPASKEDVEKAKQEIMSAVTEQLAKVEEELTVIGEGVDQVVTSIGGIGTDVAQLKADIERLQNSQGNTWTPEDQSILDRMTSTVTGLNSKTKAAADQAKALDEATAQPEPPTE
jgi:uncharacterized protein (UPF0335 family)